MTGSSIIDGTLALAFVNTVATPRARDALQTPHGAYSWVTQRLMLRSEPPALSTERRLLDEAHRLRHSLDALFAAKVAGGPPPEAAVATLDRALAAAHWIRRVTWEEEGPSPVEDLGPSVDPLALLAPVAWDAVGILSGTEAARLRRCAAEDCGLWLVDTSKGGRRRWCSMASCGSRAKATRYRLRHKGEA